MRSRSTSNSGKVARRPALTSNRTDISAAKPPLTVAASRTVPSEAIGPESRDSVSLAQTGCEPKGNEHQQRVAVMMSDCVVDLRAPIAIGRGRSISPLGCLVDVWTREVGAEVRVGGCRVAAGDDPVPADVLMLGTWCSAGDPRRRKRSAPAKSDLWAVSAPGVCFGRLCGPSASTRSALLMTQVSELAWLWAAAGSPAAAMPSLGV